MREAQEVRSKPFEAVVAQFDRFSYGLVRLEPVSPAQLRATVLDFAREVEHHLDAADGATPRTRSAPRRRALIASEHARFRGSLTELRGLLAVVENDDHGGHRQALGQYGRILAEALLIHCRDEGRGATGTRDGSASSNDK